MEIQPQSSMFPNVVPAGLGLGMPKASLFDLVAHDLRTPLSNLVLLAELMGESVDQLTLRDTARQIAKISRQMNGFLEWLMELSRNGIGHAQPQYQAFSLTCLTRELLEQRSSSAFRKHIQIETLLPTDPSDIVSDPFYIRIILDNLVSNALKYSLCGARVRVKIELNDTFALLSVADQGPGFSPEDRSRIFRRFEQLSAHPTGGETSSGFGLFLAMCLTETLGGRITLESEEGKGSTFQVEIPINTVPPIAPPRGTHQPPGCWKGLDG